MHFAISLTLHNLNRRISQPDTSRMRYSQKNAEQRISAKDTTLGERAAAWYSALSSFAGGASGITKGINTSDNEHKNLTEMKGHNATTEALTLRERKKGMILGDDAKFTMEANMNTLQCFVICSKRIDFSKHYYFHALLGFKLSVYEANVDHTSQPVNILEVNVLPIRVDICKGAYINDEQTSFIPEFISSGSKTIIHVLVSVKSIDSLTFKVVDKSAKNCKKHNSMKNCPEKLTLPSRLILQKLGYKLKKRKMKNDITNIDRRASTSLDNRRKFAYPFNSKTSLHFHRKVCFWCRGKLLKDADDTTTKINSNRVISVSDRIPYELNGTEIDSNRNLGITSTLNNWVLLTNNQSTCLQNAGWDHIGSEAVLLSNNGAFEVWYFKESKYLSLCNNDANALLSEQNAATKIELAAVEWIMPHMKVAHEEHLTLLKF
ncbi:hypothetical protein PR048_028265, partial [Dryococelus australis]